MPALARVGTSAPTMRAQPSMAPRCSASAASGLTSTTTLQARRTARSSAVPAALRPVRGEGDGEAEGEVGAPGTDMGARAASASA